ncbi:MAG: hypothetical protein M1269_04370 [Chloroflexi bacterium]|nr:hypothetical protein [Chloroflexota bacterium]
MFDRVKASLDKVAESLDESRIFDISEEQRERLKIYGQDMPEPLPALVGRYGERQVNLDFIPWAEKKYVMVLDIGLRSPFEMFIEKKGGERGLQVIRTRVPLSEIEWGDDEFRRKYVVQACLLPLVQKFLDDKSVAGLIGKLKDFEKVTIDLRYVRIYHFLEAGSRPDSRVIVSEIKILSKLADKIEALSRR